MFALLPPVSALPRRRYLNTASSRERSLTPGWMRKLPLKRHAVWSTVFPRILSRNSLPIWSRSRIPFGKGISIAKRQASSSSAMREIQRNLPARASLRKRHLLALHQGCPSFLSFVFSGEFRLSFVDFRRHLQASRHHCLSSACRFFGSCRFPSVPFESFQARSTHARLPWGDNRPCAYLRKREGSSILSRSLVSFYQISESCGLQVRRFRNVLIGRHRNRTKPYEKQEQMFYHYSHSIVAGGLLVMS